MNSQRVKPLIITSNDGTQSGRSGYDVLAEYLQEADGIVVRKGRKDPKGILEKIFRRLLIAGSGCKSYVVSSWQLEKLAKKGILNHTPDIVHMLWGDRDWGYLHKFTAKQGIPLVLTIHSIPADLPQIYPNPEQLKGIAGIILMSEHQKPFFLENGYPEDRLKVIHHGIDTHHFVPAESKSENAVPVVLSVGHTHRNFEALGQLIEKMKNDPIRFRIVSKPTFRHHFDGLDNVQFESFLSNEALLEAYQTCDVFLMTANDSTANNALLEALSCGVPIVSEAVGGLPEYLGSSGGVLVKPGAVDEIREELLKISKDAELAARLSIHARSRARELHWDHSIKEIFDFYNQLSGIL